MNKKGPNKFLKYLKKNKFSLFNFELINKINKKLKFPVVVKPINEGSSVNVFICSKKNINQTLKKMRSYKQVMIEEFIGGREIQVAIMEH